MNREILFRGKRTDNGNWVEGYLTINDSAKTYRIIVGFGLMQILSKESYECFGDFHLVYPGTVGQLLHTEKNGRKWFKGDIAEMEAVAHVSGHPVHGDDEYLHYKYTGVVEMHIREGLCIRVHKCIDVDNDEEVIFSKNLRKTITFSRSAIIGNIHDNPELLKGGDE